MRLLFVTHNSWPGVGGAESFLRVLTRELATRHEVTVLALDVGVAPYHRLRDSLLPPPPFEPFSDGPVNIEQLRIGRARRAALAPLGLQSVVGLRRYAYGPMRLGYASLYDAVVAPVLARHARSFDVLQIWGPGLLAHSAVTAATRAGVPSVVMASIHEGQWADDRVSAAAYRRADAVVAQLESEADVYRRLGVDKNRIVIQGAASPGAGEPTVDVRQRHGISGPLVLFLGARRPYKGVDLLLDAAPVISTAVPGTTFAFVGPGAPLTTTPAGTIDVGEVSDGERAAWLAAADVLVLPSAAESFGIVVLEAWSTGTPVVVSDVPALAELVSTAGGGVVVPRTVPAIAEGVIELLRDPQRCESLGQAGRDAWQRSFTPRSVGAGFESMYESLVETARGMALPPEPRDYTAPVTEGP